MQDQVQNVVQTENGPRFVLEGDFEGARIQVVTAYDATYDAWPVHVYVRKGHLDCLTDKPTKVMEATMQEAFDHGMRMGVQHLTPRTTAFQTEVKRDLSPR